MRKHKKCRLLPMDELRARPCEVDGRPALFHRWVDDDRALLHINTYCNPEEMARINYQFQQDGIIRSGCSTEVIRKTYALVEYPGGTVHLVDPLLITFTDKEGK